MAQLVGLNVYQINQRDPFPAGQSQRFDFPFAGILVRTIPGGTALSSGVIVYSAIQAISTGDQYLVVETSQALAALS